MEDVWDESADDAAFERSQLQRDRQSIQERLYKVFSSFFLLFCMNL